MMTPSQIAEKLIREMELDNGVSQGGMLGCLKDEKRAELFTKLHLGVVRMWKAGCRFTKDDISEIAAGEATEIEEKFSKFDGWAEVNDALNKIFDPERDWIATRKERAANLGMDMNELLDKALEETYVKGLWKSGAKPRELFKVLQEYTKCSDEDLRNYALYCLQQQMEKKSDKPERIQ